MEEINIFVILSIILWLILFIYWIINSKERGIINEIAGLAKLIISGLVLYIPVFFSIKILAYKQNMVSNAAGLIINFLGFIICITGRKYLSKNWSGKVTLQEKHTLIKNGPYKIIRHPIYSGVLIMMLGSGIIAGNLFGFIWVFFCFFGLFRKSKQEEKLLEQEFGEAYAQYKKETKMLVPFIL